MMEARRAIGMTGTVRENLKNERELNDEEKGRVGLNRACYPG